MISFEGLEKRFGRVRALREVDLEIAPGKITGILGPNGSGKTTLIKCLLGLVKPTNGVVVLDGLSLNGECEYRREIGYMPQLSKLPENLRVGQLLNLVRSLRPHETEQSGELVQLFNLKSELGKRVRQLSGGTRQKLSAVIALMFDPRILILDEPTAGLDPIAATDLKQLIQRRRDAGRTVILTSHLVNEVAELCDDLVFLAFGKIHFKGTATEMRQATGEAELERALASLMRTSK